jgi:serine/threonine-protein kinase
VAPELGQAIAGLDPTQRAALDSGRAIDQFRVHFANQEWVGRARPMGANGDTKLGSVLVLASADRFISGYRMILNWVLLAGLSSNMTWYYVKRDKARKAAGADVTG